MLRLELLVIQTGAVDNQHSGGSPNESELLLKCQLPNCETVAQPIPHPA